MSQWINKATNLKNELSRVRRHFHMNPEPGFAEVETARFICEYLDNEGIAYERIGETGVVASLDTGREGQTIAYRADIDALPVEEANECEYKSQKPGFMHACGHDAHAAVLLVSVKFIRDNLDKLSGAYRFIFQPAEESPPGGALGLIEAGALEGVDAVYGLHVNPDIEVGRIGVIDGPMMAAADRFTVKVIGRGGHGASPHQTKDAIPITAQLINNLQTIVSRNVNPLDSAVVTVGKIQGGFRFNVIAETCELDGTVRTLLPEVRELVKNRMEETIRSTVAVHAADYEFDYQYGYPPLINHADNVNVIRSVAEKVLGQDAVFELPYPSMGGEDFSYFVEKVPGAFFRLGTRLTDKEQYPLHNAKFDLDEQALVYGVQLFAGLAEHYSK